MEQYPLTEDHVSFFRDNGYVRLDGVLAVQEVEALRTALDVAVEDRRRYDRNEGPRADPGYAKVFLQMVNLWERYPAFRAHALNPRIGEIARRLARAGSVRLWHDHALVKYPKDSKPTVWHQDWVYWPMHETGALSCWMALDDVTVKNGCMSFIPGSHTLGPCDPIDLGNATEETLLAKFPAEQRKKFRPVAVEMKAGSCTFHDGLTFHYAGPNVSESPRRAIVTIYMPGGTRYRTLEHIVGDRAGLTEGEAFHGPLFPVVVGE